MPRISRNIWWTSMEDAAGAYRRCRGSCRPRVAWRLGGMQRGYAARGGSGSELDLLQLANTGEYNFAARGGTIATWSSDTHYLPSTILSSTWSGRPSTGATCCRARGNCGCRSSAPLLQNNIIWPLRRWRSVRIRSIFSAPSRRSDPQIHPTASPRKGWGHAIVPV
jgi:hypothetical protein